MFKDEHLVKALADLDLAKLLGEGADVIVDGQAGITRIINQLDNTLGFKVVKGNMTHLLVVADALKRQSGSFRLVGIEVQDTVTRAKNGAYLPGRRIDLIVEVNGQRIAVELKNIQADRLDTTLANLMSSKPLKDATEQGAEEAGQLLSDLVKFIDNGFQGRQVWFTPDVIPNLGGVKPTAAQVEAMQRPIGENILKRVKKSDADIAKRYFDIDVSLPEGRQRFEDILDDSVFVKIVVTPSLN